MPGPKPRFLSIAFHLRYFPGVLLARLRPDPEASRPTFAQHGWLEMYLMLTGCVILLAIGVPLATGAHPILGWSLAGVGLVGALLLVIHSIGSRQAAQPGFEAFRVPVFFFLLLLGPNAAVMVLPASSLLVSICCGAGGLLLGYALGIAAGLVVQYLGWMAFALDLLAIVGTAGLVLFDVLSLLL